MFYLYKTLGFYKNLLKLQVNSYLTTLTDSNCEPTLYGDLFFNERDLQFVELLVVLRYNHADQIDSALSVR